MFALPSHVNIYLLIIWGTLAAYFTLMAWRRALAA